MMELFGVMLAIIFLFFAVCFFTHRIGGLAKDISIFISGLVTATIVSFIYYISLVLSFHSFATSIFVIALLSFTGVVIKLKAADSSNIRLPVLRPYLSLSTALFLIVSCIALIRMSIFAKKWGEWDAWAIWTLHGKFMADPAHWTNLFSPYLAGSHPDYPLMLPALLAIPSRYMGEMFPVIPLLFSTFVLVGIVGTIYFQLYREQGFPIAIGATIILIADNEFLRLAGSQYADTLLAFVILCSMVLYRQQAISFNKVQNAMLGFVVATGVWVKNEGQLYLLIFTIYYVFQFRKKKSYLLSYFIGTLIPVCILIHFKMQFAPDNDIFAGNRNTPLLFYLTNADRYIKIAGAMLSTIFLNYWVVPVLLIFCLIKKEKIYYLPLLILFTLLLGYCGVYLFTPNDLQWHLDQSIIRLVHHIYPAAIFVLFSGLRDDRYQIFSKT